MPTTPPGRPAEAGPGSGKAGDHRPTLSPAIRPVPPLKAAAGQDLFGPAYGGTQSRIRLSLACRHSASSAPQTEKTFKKRNFFHRAA